MRRFVAILGDYGSGKTNLMTAMLYNEHKEGVPVIANYKLTFPYHLKPFTELVKLEEDLHGSVIGMDELGEGADSYEFFSGEVKRLGKLITQIRKRECRVYYTVQRFSMIAARLRRLTEGYILMEDLDKHDVDHSVFGNCNSLYKCTFLDEAFQKQHVMIFDGKPYRDMYNTHEIVWGYDSKGRMVQE